MSQSEIERKLIEEQPEKFFRCESEPVHNCDVHISIPAKGLDLQKIFQAEQLLREAGLSFDTGYGCGSRDWEFDWSLRGAYVKKVRDLNKYEQRAYNLARIINPARKPFQIPCKVLNDTHGGLYLVIFGRREQFGFPLLTRLSQVGIKPTYKKDGVTPAEGTELEVDDCFIGFRWGEELVKVSYTESEEGY